MNSNQVFSPPLRRGRCAVLNKCHATLNRAQRGRSCVVLQQAFDLPGRAESKVALHLLDRRGHPSSKAHVSKLALRKSFRGASRTAETTIGGLEVSF
jgi:hypothetical protein